LLYLTEVFVNSQSLVLVEDEEQREREKPNHGGSKLICPRSRPGLFVLLGPVRILLTLSSCDVRLVARKIVIGGTPKF
jgi:hypothetical protein